jgi:hypothetical protein
MYYWFLLQVSQLVYKEVWLHWSLNPLVSNGHESVIVRYIFMESHSSKQHLQYENYLGWVFHVLNTAGCIYTVIWRGEAREKK